MEGEGAQAEGATETVEVENITGGWPIFVTEEVREAIFTLCFEKRDIFLNRYFNRTPFNKLTRDGVFD